MSSAPASGAPGAELAADQPAAHRGAMPCSVVRVMSSLENADTVRALAKAYVARPRDVGGLCVTVQVTAEQSGLAEAEAASGFAGVPASSRPAIWLPDSSAWLGLARRAGSVVVPASAPGVARSDVVVALPAPLARAIGWDRHAPSWGQVFATATDTGVWKRLGHPQWGAFKLAKATPGLATSGLMALTAAFQSALGKGSALSAAAVQSSSTLSRVHIDELATSHYMSTPAHVLAHAAEAHGGSLAPYLSAMIIDEKTMWDYNHGATAGAGGTDMGGMGGMGGSSTSPSSPPKGMGKAPTEKLVPIYPSEGVFQADNPAAVLEGGWIDPTVRAAAMDFVQFARSMEGQDVVRATGYRDITDRSTAAPTAAGDRPHLLTMPSTAVLSAVQSSFPAVRKRARVLFLLDVSGSMSDRIPSGRTKLDAAKQAVTNALRYFGPQDEVGVAAFSDRHGRSVIPGQLTAVAPLARNAGAIRRSLAGLRPIASTPLYRAVDTYSARLAQRYDPSKINAIVLLSDGRNDTTIRETRAQLMSHLAALHRRAPVLIFTLAYGRDADTGLLKAVASASGAHYYDATNPGRVNQVLSEDLITSL